MSKITIKDEGEFKNGEAVSELTIVDSDKYNGKGNYRANHKSSSFFLEIQFAYHLFL